MKRNYLFGLFIFILAAFLDSASYSYGISVGNPNLEKIDFYDVDVIHSGSEQVIVGPLADEASGYGFVPDENFTVSHMALGGNGNNLWFITYYGRHPNDTDRQRLYYINVDGTDVARSPVPLDLIKYTSEGSFPYIHNLSTGDSGGRAVIEARRTTDLGITSSAFFDVIKGSVAFEFFDALPYNSIEKGPYSPNKAGIKMSNHSLDVWWTDGHTIWRLPMDAINSSPSR